MKKMKKLTIIPILVIAFSFIMTSCKKDVENRLLGEWKLTNTETTTLPSPDSDINVGTMKFDEDGSGVISITDEELDTSPFLWSSTDEKVLITVDDETFDFTIILNESKLQKWEHIASETVIVEDNGVEYESPLVIEIKLEK